MHNWLDCRTGYIADVKTKEVAPPVAPEKEGNVGMALGNNGGRMIESKSTMRGVTAALSNAGDRPDGIEGLLRFDVKWSGVDGQSAATGLGSERLGLVISMLATNWERV